VTRKTSFYYSFLALPAPQRHAILAVFDFCRAVDDSVDLETDESRAIAALGSWRDEVARVFDGGAPQTEEGRHLQPFVKACDLPRAEFEALVSGVEMDIAPRRFATFAELEPYCHRVASSVGLMCAAVFGARDPESLTYARDLGVALQLTNILRDVAVDFRRGRCYLPIEDLERFGCTEADIAAQVEGGGRAPLPDRVRGVLEHQAARARVFFGRAARALPKHQPRRFVAAEIMHGVYRDLLRRIEAAGCDVFGPLIRVPRPAQAVIAVRTWWRLPRR
jgi:phytoene synthase